MWGVDRVVRDGQLHGTAREVGALRQLATAFLNGVDWAAKIISVGALAGLTTVVMVLVPGLADASDGLRRSVAAGIGDDQR